MKLSYEKQMQRAVFKDPMQKINERYMMLDMSIKNIQNNMVLRLKEKQKVFESNVSKLDTLSPLKTLSRGYSIATNNGKIVKSKNYLQCRDTLNIKVTDGNIEAKVI